MDFKISTPITAVCALAAFIAIQLTYEIPSGLVCLFFTVESIAIFIVNLLYFIGLMLEKESSPALHIWIGFISLVHASCFIGLSAVLIVSCSGETIQGFEPAVFDDNYKLKVLVGSSFGVITSIVLFIQFFLPLKAITAL